MQPPLNILLPHALTLFPETPSQQLRAIFGPETLCYGCQVTLRDLDPATLPPFIAGITIFLAIIYISCLDFTYSVNRIEEGLKLCLLSTFLFFSNSYCGFTFAPQKLLRGVSIGEEC